MNIRHKRKEKEESVSTARELFQWVAAIVAAVLIALAIDNFVIVNAQIPSGSMENTIMTGDRIFGFRMAYGLNFDFFGKHISYKTKDPERFDIIIFKFPDDESQLFIKRLIGLPGETVEIRDGKVYINGSDEPLDDSFVPEVPTGNYGPYRYRKTVTLCSVTTANIPETQDSGKTHLYPLMRLSEKPLYAIIHLSNF